MLAARTRQPTNTGALKVAQRINHPAVCHPPTSDPYPPISGSANSMMTLPKTPNLVPARMIGQTNSDPPQGIVSFPLTVACEIDQTGRD